LMGLFTQWVLAQSSWTTQVAPSTNSWTSIAWGGPVGQELFVAVAQTGTGNRIMTSPDGISWTSRSSVADNRWRRVIWGGPAGQELFVAVAESATSHGVMTSPDGINWTGQNAGNGLRIKNITWGGPPGQELFVGVDEASAGISNQSITSPDGIHWTTRTLSITGGYWKDIAWGGPSGQELFIAVASTGMYRLMKSSDGINWSSIYLNINVQFTSITWGGPPGQELFVALARSGTGHRVITSSDGITWTRRAAAADKSWASVTWGGQAGRERFVAVADQGYPNSVMSSPDGITWTLETAVNSEGWNGVAWGGPAGQERFVAVSPINADQIMASETTQTINSWTANEIVQQTYTGLPITPQINVENGGVPMTENTDFTVAYTHHIDVGTAIATIHGIGAYTGTITQTFIIAAKTLTVTATDVQKVYDGQPTTGWTATYEGFVPSENELNLIGTLTFSGTGTTAIEVGSFPISPYGLSSNNYDLHFVDGVVSITPLAVTITPDVLSKTYGETDPALTYTMSATSSATLSVRGALYRDPGEDVGFYSIGLGTLTNTNYIFNLLAEDFEITPLAVTVTPDALSKTYGEADPALTYTMSATSSATLIVDGALSRDSGEDVGDYAVGLGTLYNTNYILSLSPEYFSIAPLAVTVSPDVLSKTYGSIDPTLTYSLSATSSATLNVSGALSRDSGENVGDYAIGLGTLTNSNYTLNLAAEDFEITPLAVQVIPDVLSKTYGSTDPTLTYSLSATSSATLTATGSLTRTSGEDVGDYPIQLGTLTNTNYTLNLLAEDFEIIPLVVEVIPDVLSKTYGEVDPVLTYSLSATSSATLTATGSLTRTSGEDVGDYAIQLGTLTNTNYTLNLLAEDFVITPLVVTVTPDVLSKTYGEADPLLTYTLSATSSATLSVDGTLTREPGENVGDYAIQLGTMTNTNYTLNLLAENFVITPLVVTVTPDVLSKTYGEADPQLTYTLSATSSATLTATGALTRALGEDVGTYAVVWGTLSNDNYDMSLSSEHFTIEAKTLTVTAEDITQVFNNQIASGYSARFEGFVHGEGPANLSGDLLFSGSALNAVNYGIYSINVSGLTSDNYRINYLPGILTIEIGLDTDLDGIPDLIDLDKDGDGFSNLEEEFCATDPLDDTKAPTDTDQDGVADCMDTDDDNDGILDTEDVSPLDPTVWADLDTDSAEDNSDTDVDEDGTTNPEEEQINPDPVDSSDDSTDTEQEVPSNEHEANIDGNGVIENATDPDGDEINDTTNLDVDNDGVLDTEDVFPLDPTEWVDLDADGIGDNSDTDVDGDGYSNQDEQTCQSDSRDATDVPADTDQDGLADCIDSDDDNDGVLDIEDAFPLDPAEWADLDADGTGDNSDQDVDGDGFSNQEEQLCATDPRDASDVPTDTDRDGNPDCIDADDDNDGVLDTQDVFPLDSAEWADLDGDGIGDNSDPDVDGDGIPNQADTTPLGGTTPVAGVPDFDGDGISDDFDLDDDNDGLSDEAEAAIGSNPKNIDSDQDGVTDAQEVTDGTDPTDACALVVSSQSIAENTALWDQADCDGDGIPNAQELTSPTVRTDGKISLDSDQDGIPNFRDEDDDNDSVPTALEISLSGFVDTDGDGVMDHLDSDDDNDGITTAMEVLLGSNYLSIDSDGDGVTDGQELQDGTGINDERSLVRANQTITSNKALWDQKDFDGDGILNGFEINADSDKDKTPDFLDADDDGDGLPTQDEQADPNGDGNPSDAYDADNDGIADYLDSNSYTPSARVAEDIEVYNALSPNGDGYNDVLTIRNIEKYPDNELIITNNWGQEIYRVKGYGQSSNYFTGTVPGSSESLPVGTYYYVLQVQVEGQQRSFTGYFYSNR